MRLERQEKQKTAQIVLCAFDKEKLLRASFLVGVMGIIKYLRGKRLASHCRHVIIERD